ncbi:MAG: PD-(D/E)XK nuclease family transposase [Succinivibrio sp.]|nr:PD-(D/E)XK nuclease family transposase [Succinivibrio sp.]
MSLYVPGVFVNPFTGFGFRRLFGTESNKDLLISFLNTFLEPVSPIEDIRFLSPEELGRSSFIRTSVADIYCQCRDDSCLLVELQVCDYCFFRDFEHYCESFPITRFAPRGKLADTLKAVYAVGVLGFAFDGGHQDELRHTVHMALKETVGTTVDYLNMVYLEVPNFKKKVEDLRHDFERWLYVLQNLVMLDERPAELSCGIFPKLFETTRISALTPEEERQYFFSLRTYWDNGATLEAIRERNRTMTAQERAREMKDKGAPLDLIVKYTHLSADEIKKL